MWSILGYLYQTLAGHHSLTSQLKVLAKPVVSNSSQHVSPVGRFQPCCHTQYLHLMTYSSPSLSELGLLFESDSEIKILISLTWADAQCLLGRR